MREKGRLPLEVHGTKDVSHCSVQGDLQWGMGYLINKFKWSGPRGLN